MAVEQPPNRAQRNPKPVPDLKMLGNLDKRDVRRRIDQRQDIPRMRFDPV